jgi:hypothetical protein
MVSEPSRFVGSSRRGAKRGRFAYKQKNSLQRIISVVNCSYESVSPNESRR